MKKEQSDFNLVRSSKTFEGRDVRLFEARAERNNERESESERERERERRYEREERPENKSE